MMSHARFELEAPCPFRSPTQAEGEGLRNLTVKIHSFVGGWLIRLLHRPAVSELDATPFPFAASNTRSASGVAGMTRNFGGSRGKGRVKNAGRRD